MGSNNDAQYELTLSAVERSLNENSAVVPQTRLRQIFINELMTQTIRAQEDILGVRSRLVVNTLITNPKYQGQSIASDVLSLAVEHANSQCRLLGAQVPISAGTLFERQKFEERGRVGMDWDEYADALGKKEWFGEMWGKQEWKSMVLDVGWCGAVA